MTFFRDLSIRGKLMLVIMSTCVLALLMACAVFVAGEVVLIRSRMARTLTVRADVVGANSAAAMTFNDRQAAEETLAMLRADPSAFGARIFAADGRPFASYLRVGAEGLPSSAPAEGHRFTAGRLEVVRPLLLDGRPIGVIYVAQDLGEMYRSFELLGGMALAVLVVCSFAAWALAARFQRLISGPLLRLNETAAAIASRGDYSMRAAGGSKDELGALVNSFNEMIHQIQKRDSELERRVAERTAELSAANAELESFSYSVSHDLRAPLRGIAGFAQIILEDSAASLDEAGKKHLGRVVAGTKLMGTLIDDILGLSRISRTEMRRAKVDLTEMARGVVKDLQGRDPSRRVEVTLPDGLIADGDPQLLRIVLVNLLGNAWKYTGKKDAARIEVGASSGENGETVFFVKDSGAGFDMAYSEKLFGAFQRLHTQAEFEGTGVGLATVRRIISRHGGKIWAQSAVEEGATFFFTLQRRMP